MRKDLKVELLRRVPLFERCSKRELREIAAIADEFQLAEDKDVLVQGSTGREFLIVVSGALAVRRNGTMVASLGAGDFVGEIALITGKPRNATVLTTEVTRLLVITQRDFERLLRDIPSIQSKVMQELAARLEPND
jgi:CRP/FNR family transcriptional regulator, cyclic AMP receptor protein